MTPARWQLYLLCREKALGNDQQLMMVREPGFHAHAIVDSLLRQMAHMPARRPTQLVIPKKYRARRKKR